MIRELKDVEQSSEGGRVAYYLRFSNHPIARTEAFAGGLVKPNRSPNTYGIYELVRRRHAARRSATSRSILQREAAASLDAILTRPRKRKQAVIQVVGQVLAR
ncbi:hypothetical protein EPN44_06305 [bacterium]|nr:MAG: hypothetical protein EPN44_06305 [bacterium]